MIYSKNFISATQEMSSVFRCIPSPYLRKKVVVNKAIKKAQFTICGLGFYRFWLNGKELTKSFLSPWISNPDQMLDYNCYDLTAQLQNGANLLAFQLGNGMQNAFGGYVWGFEKATFRSAPKMACCLEVQYQDGTTEQIEADESFLCCPSPLLRDDLRFGEIYDANCQIDGWNQLDFDDSKWSNALVASCPKGQPTLCIGKPIVQEKELSVLSITQGEWTPAVSKTHHYGYVYDFGLNTAGIVTLKIRGYKGQKVTITFGELLHEGKFYTDNISFVGRDMLDKVDYVQQVQFICSGNDDVYQPSFTYFGFRYAFVEGITQEQATKDLLTYNVMHTQLDEMGNFTCSWDKLNALQAMTRVATLSNFMHFPTDCPHREKNGWTADAALSAEHTLLNVDATSNYCEWIRHISKAQNEQGALPGIVPTPGWGFEWGNGPAWDQVLVELPYLVYRYKGNEQIIKDSIDSLFKYSQYLQTRLDENGLLAIGLGDWVAPFGVDTPLLFTDSVMAMSINQKTAFLASVVGRSDVVDYCTKCAIQLKENVRKHLVDFDTCRVAGATQTSQAMAIYYDVLTQVEKQKAFAVLLDCLKKRNNHLDTGVLGARVIFHVLEQFGYADFACDVITEPTAPSYGYWLEKGYTALAEDLWTDDIMIQSKNHHFWGDISAFFIKDICGINFNPNGNDLHFLQIKPNFIEKMDFADAYHVCPSGKIAVRWERVGDQVKLIVNVPNQVKYQVVLPKNYTQVSSDQTDGKVVIFAKRK